MRPHLPEWRRSVGAARARADGSGLARPIVESSHVAATEDDLGIQRIGSRVAVLVDAHREPLTNRDGAVIAARGDARRSTLLLTTADAIRKVRVCGDVIHLRGRLVVPGTPGLAIVERHHGALIGDEDHDSRIVRVDPSVLIILSAGRALERHPPGSSVSRSEGHDVGHDDVVRIAGMDEDIGFGDALVARAVVCRRLRPGLSPVVRSVEHAATSATAAATALP